MADWLLLHYTVGSKASAQRVYIWRKLKRLGALLLQDAVWILPHTARTAEHLRWLATEIQEMEGEAVLWRSQLAFGLQEDVLRKRFRAQVDEEYAGLLHQLERKGADLPAISQQYQQAHTRDYFDSELGRRLRKKLVARRGDAR